MKVYESFKASSLINLSLKNKFLNMVKNNEADQSTLSFDDLMEKKKCETMAHPHSKSRSSLALVDEVKGNEMTAKRLAKKSQFNNNANANANDETMFNNLPNVFSRSG
jgi:hypothetical protein